MVHLTRRIVLFTVRKRALRLCACVCVCVRACMCACVFVVCLLSKRFETYLQTAYVSMFFANIFACLVLTAAVENSPLKKERFFAVATPRKAIGTI